MKLHNLKIRPKYYDAIRSGVKTFEIRKADREFEVGDIINFAIAYNNGYNEPTSHLYKITYILRDCEEYGLMKGYYILAIKEIKE